MNKISFYFCDLFIVKMLRIWSYPSKNKETKKVFHLEFDAETESSLTHTWVTDFWFGDMLRIILLRNSHKKWVNTYKNSLYVWCWFVMFASESSHASSFKISWICDTQKNRNPQRSALLEYMHWDLMMPPLKNSKTEKKMKKIKYTANKTNTLWFIHCMSVSVNKDKCSS